VVLRHLAWVPEDAKRIELGVGMATFGEAFIDPCVQVDAQ
jgi:hypothetical protein